MFVVQKFFLPSLMTSFKKMIESSDQSPVRSVTIGSQSEDHSFAPLPAELPSRASSRSSHFSHWHVVRAANLLKQKKGGENNSQNERWATDVKPLPKPSSTRKGFRLFFCKILAACKIQNGDGHFEMGVRAVIVFVQAIATVILLSNEIDVYHNGVVLSAQIVNCISLFHQFFKNWVNDFLIRSIMHTIRLFSVIHLTICGRRNFAALGWGNSTIHHDFVDSVKEGYPSAMPERSRVCFLPQYFGDSGEWGSEESGEYLLPFRIIHAIYCIFQFAYALSLFLHWKYPVGGIAYAREDEISHESKTILEGVEEDSEISEEFDNATNCRNDNTQNKKEEVEIVEEDNKKVSARIKTIDRNESNLRLTKLKLTVNTSEVNAEQEFPASQNVMLHGPLWVYWRCWLCVAMGSLHLLRGVLKLTVFPEGSYFVRTPEEIFVNFWRCFFRFAAAYSLYKQYWNAQPGWSSVDVLVLGC